MVKQTLVLLVMLFIAGRIDAQSVNVTFAVDTSDVQVQTAVRFLQSYIDCFAKKQKPDYSYYWSTEDCKRTSLPDDMVFAISSDGATYRFGDKLTVFFAQKEEGVVHLKTVLATADSARNIMVWAIMNHYVIPGKDHPRFISEVCLHKGKYKSIRNGNINYHFPSSTAFNKAVSDRMLRRVRKLEHNWGFKPIDIDYYYASDDVSLAHMRGFDYVFGIGKQTPSGISHPERQVIYCQGLGEGYLHEILHIYFNPQYEQSPMCHPLIYYLAGGIGKDFDWMLHRMNEYLTKYPETDLSAYETLQTKDPMLHIDYVTSGLLCKMLDKKYGRDGLKRALQYKTSSELLQTEFGITTQTADTFLRASFKKYDKLGQKM